MNSDEIAAARKACRKAAKMAEDANDAYTAARMELMAAENGGRKTFPAKLLQLRLAESYAKRTSELAEKEHRRKRDRLAELIGAASCRWKEHA